VKRHARLTVPRETAGRSVIDLVSRRFTYHTRDAWLAEIRQGRLLVNGIPARPDQPLAAGDGIEYLVPDLAEPAVNRTLATVFEDSSLLVLNKPANLPCHPAGRFFHNTVWAILKEERAFEAPAFVNRLDRETSGLLVVARTAAAARRCRAQFARRRVAKTYLVLVEGLFPELLTARGYLGADPACEVRKKRSFVPASADIRDLSADPGAGEWAETAFSRLSELRGISLVAARPVTGRLHQIRATLCSLGFPVVGDKLYGVDPTLFLRFLHDALTDDDRRRLRLERQALHAAALRFRHPETGALLEFSVPLPADMASLAGPPTSGG